MPSPNKPYYVYLHRRKDDGVVFYVGKGCGKRAWVIARRNQFWTNVFKKHGRLVEIVARDLSESEAFSLEKDLIALHNPACNLTLGGDGKSGYVASEETKQKIKTILSIPEVRKKLSEKAFCQMQSKEAKARSRLLAAQNFSTPDSKAKALATKATTEVKEKTKQSLRAAWSNPEIRAKRIAAMKKGWEKSLCRVKTEASR